MAMIDALAALRDGWPRVAVLLDHGTRDDVAGLAEYHGRRDASGRTQAERDDWSGPSGARLILDLVAPSLPPTDPVIEALASARTRRTVREPDGDVVLGLALVTGARAETGAGPWTVLRLQTAGRLRLLDRVEMVPARPGRDGRDEGLIELDTADGRVVPAFQLAAGGQIDPAVAAANRALGADRDPWGALSWWSEVNGWLGSTPADGLLVGRADEVVAAARLVRGEG